MDETLKQTDPVCGMEVTDAAARASSEFEGNPYFFCSLECLEKFRKDPEFYVDRLGLRDMEHSAV